MRNSLSKMQYLLFALLMLAMTGCGANKVGTASTSNGAGNITSKVVWTAKTAGKTVGSTTTIPSNVMSLRMTVTGTDNTGNPIPVVRSTTAVTPGATAATTTVAGVYPGSVTLTVLALDANGNVLYEGFALRLAILDGQTNNSCVTNPIQMAVPVTKAQDAACVNCHETTLDIDGQNLVAGFKQSGHYFNQTWVDNAKFGITGTGCAGCHGPNHNDANPSNSGRCAECHSATYSAGHNTVATNPGWTSGAVTNACEACHGPHETLGANCLGCHSVGQNAAAYGNFVNDNSGVRAVVPEFGKNAHHVVGKTLTSADCAVCHKEGTTGGGVDFNYHMKDAKIHLRNGNTTLYPTTNSTDNGEFLWDPANPDHSAMDHFCMSCHNANGAPAAVGIVSGNTATNPFNDAISNGYDQMSRPAVVAVYDQFDPANASHHAVRAQKYTTRVSNHTGTTIWNQYSSATTGSGGHRSTLYEAGMFTSYIPLGSTTPLGDDSTIHCGDCHTVGQYKPKSTTAFASYSTVTTTAVIGAHGSNNEYLLRNAHGDDALHHQDGANGSVIANPTTRVGVQAAGANYVCYLCHNVGKYGSNMAHEGIDGGNACNGPLRESVGLSGAGVRVQGLTTATGNAFGFTCANCHNAGQQGFGGIHGRTASFKAYSGVTDATGASFGLVDRKPYRFMGGMSLRYNGGNAPSTGSWERKTFAKTSHDGCYNLTTAADVVATTPTVRKTIRLWGTDATANANNPGFGDTSSDQNNGTIAGSWGACGHHTGTTTAGNPTAPTRTVQRPLSY